MTISTADRLGFRLGGVNLRLGLAQINTVVGDLDGNRERMPERIAEAKRLGVDLAALPRARGHRLPARGPAAAARVRARGRAVARAARARGARDRRARRLPALRPRPLQRVRGLRRRRGQGRLPQALPAELRRLRRGALLRVRPRPDPARARQDARRRDDLRGPLAAGPPATDLALAGAQLVVNLSASPFHLDKDREREEMLVTRARDNSCFVALCNAVGGQDELIFDGHSVVLDDDGEVIARAPGFEEALLVVDVEPEARDRAAAARRAPPRARARARRDAASRGRARRRAEGRRPTASGSTASSRRCTSRSSRCGSRSSSASATTSTKNGFREVVLGVSGGIDSALTAALAVGGARRRARALRLDAVALLVGRRRRPMRGGSPSSLGAHFLELPIEPIVPRVRGRARRRLRRTRARPGRGEPPGAHPRRAADGALEQVRLARCSRRGTSRSSRSATRRCTATWRAASRCSRTSTRPTSSGSRAT